MKLSKLSLRRIHYRIAILYIGIPITVLLLAIFSALYPPFKKYEKIITAQKFRIRGEQVAHNAIVWINIDQEIQDSLKYPGSALRCYERAIWALRKMGSEVVGLELDFEANPQLIDELFLERLSGVDSNLVIGCIFKPADFMGDLKSVIHRSDDLRHFISTIRVGYLKTLPDDSLLFSEIFETDPLLAHLNIISNQNGTDFPAIPFCSGTDGHTYPAFGLEILRRYYKLSKKQISVFTDRLKFPVPGEGIVELPFQANDAIALNFLGDSDTFDHPIAFSEILQLHSRMRRTGFECSTGSRFKDSIVLITNSDVQNKFSMPFSESCSGMMLNATLITNILNQRVLTYVDQHWTIGILVFFAIMVAIVLMKLKIRAALLSIALIWFAYNSLSLIFFIRYDAVLSALPPNLFLIFSAVAAIIVKMLNFTKRVSQQQLSEQSLQLTKIEEKLVRPYVACPYYKIVILLMKLRHECALSHTLISQKGRAKGLGAFEAGQQTKHPHVFNMNKLNKLSHNIQKLWELYHSITRENSRPSTKPIHLLKKIGQDIETEFGLSATLDNIVKSSAQNTYLNFVLDDLTIPWQWAYHPKWGKFLCDQFPTSTSFAIEKEDFGDKESSGELPIEQPNEKGVLLLYGKWCGHHSKELRCVEREIRTIEKKIGWEKDTTVTTTQDVDVFLSTLDAYSRKRLNLRVIHYSGHVEGDRMDISETQYLRAGTIKHTRNLYFHSHPIIFLNGCSSGDLGYLWDKYDDLATEFLACGAAACIITHFDIVETTASKFSVQFYKNFVDKRLSVGEALRQTRLDLSKPQPEIDYDPDYDITRYFYNLYGDPTVKFQG
ncbi:CHASE2 domain-containing protein [candidate division KSB1 bacterium]|nr:CHASE2 domain-containing protein [candidate division KSB1 bacterium]